MKLPSLVVADSSPLNVFIRLGYGDVLAAMYGRVFVPPEVVAELTHANTPEVVRRLIGGRPAWLEVRSPGNVLPLNNLDPGERAAISLAVELGALLLIDERTGRREAEAMGLTIIGVIGLLEIAADRGLIDSLQSAHDALSGIGFRVSKAMLAESLARHDARRNG